MFDYLSSILLERLIFKKKKNVFLSFLTNCRITGKQRLFFSNGDISVVKMEANFFRLKNNIRIFSYFFGLILKERIYFSYSGLFRFFN